MDDDSKLIEEYLKEKPQKLKKKATKSESKTIKPKQDLKTRLKSIAQKSYRFVLKNKVGTLSLLVLFGVFLIKYQEERHQYLSKFKSLDETESLYSILEVPSNADLATIKANYRKLSLKWHPDKNPGCLECPEKIDKIRQAFNILSSPRLREVYDNERGVTFDIIPSSTEEINYNNFNNLVKNSGKLWLVQVYSDLEDSCKSFSPVWEDLHNKFKGLLKFGRINAMQDKSVLRLLPIKIKLYPTLILFKPNRTYEIVPKFNNSAQLSKFIFENFPSNVNVISDHSQLLKNNDGKPSLLFVSTLYPEPTIAIKSGEIALAKSLSVYYLHTNRASFKDLISKTGQTNIDLDSPQAYLLFDHDNNVVYSESLNTLKISKNVAQKIYSNCSKRLVLDVNYFNLDYLCFPENKETRFCVVTKSASLADVVGLESEEEDHPIQVVRHTHNCFLSDIANGENYILDVSKGRFCVLGDGKFACNAQKFWQNELALGISDSLNWYPLPYKCRGKDKVRCLWSCMKQGVAGKLSAFLSSKVMALGIL